MLVKFECENHKSIKDRIVFSTEATKDTAHKENLISMDGTSYLRMAVIYGANGSGKSNILGALEFVKALVINSIQHQPGQGVFQAPHRLSVIAAPSKYEVVFTTKGKKYEFGFSVKHNLIAEEHLYYYPGKRKVPVYTRDENEIKEGPKHAGLFDVAKSVMKDNRLFLSCSANYSNNEEVVNAFLFFRDELVTYNISPNNWIDYSIRVLNQDPQVKKQFLSILNGLGTGIKDVKTRYEVRKLTYDDFPGMPDALKPFIQSSEGSLFSAKVIYDEFETDLMMEESSGIKKLFELICPIIDIVLNNKTLVCDEFEAGFHEVYVMEIIKLFNTIKQDSSAQLIFTTHNTNLMDHNVFRRDQIWFTEMKMPERATMLFPLSSLHDVRKNEKFSSQYIKGKYGAIPVLNESLAEFASNN